MRPFGTGGARPGWVILGAARGVRPRTSSHAPPASATAIRRPERTAKRMRTIGVGLVGLGTVGSGVVEILRRHREDFERRAGVGVELVRFADRNPGGGVGLCIDAGAF